MSISVRTPVCETPVEVEPMVLVFIAKLLSLGSDILNLFVLGIESRGEKPGWLL